MLTPWGTGQIGVRGWDSGVPTAPGFGPDSVAPINPHRTRKPPPANRRGPSCLVALGRAWLHVVMRGPPADHARNRTSVVEPRGIEPLTPTLQRWCSTN